MLQMRHQCNKVECRECQEVILATHVTSKTQERNKIHAISKTQGRNRIRVNNKTREHSKIHGSNNRRAKMI
jgi:hypothetical protein